MNDLTEILRELFNNGTLIVPIDHVGGLSTAGAEEFLAEAFAEHSLNVAGPPIAFERRVAMEASRLFMQAAIALVDHSETPEVLSSRLRMSRVPHTAADHLSADIVFRYLPHLLRRARASRPDDPLVVMLTQVLRQWPLSGVLADIDEAPSTKPEFPDHHGLLMLYSERWILRQDEAWKGGGATGEYIEWALEDVKRAVTTGRN